MASPRIFISYASKDQAAALEVCEVLESAGLSCWIAPRNIPAGKNYASEIPVALRECPIVLLLLTGSANKSIHIPQEIDVAFCNRREILILRLEEIDPHGPLEYYLSGKQWLDAFPLPLKPHLEPLIKRAREILGLSAPSAALETTKPVVVPQQSTLEGPARGFCLPWSAWDPASSRIGNAAVLITDHRSLTASDISRVAKECRKARRTLVVVAPALEAAAISEVNSWGGFAIEAKSIDGQPSHELLEDLAVYLGGYALLGEIGFGLPQRPKPEDTVNGIARRFKQMADVCLEDDLGKAAEVCFDRNRIRFEAEHPGSWMDWQVRVLKYRAMHCARSREEFNSLLERLRRFGVVESTPESLVPAAAFAQTGDEIILPAGFASRYFIAGSDCRCTLDFANVLVTAFPLHQADTVISALELVAAEGKNESNPLAVFAPRIDEEARALLVMNRLRGIVQTLGVETNDTEELAAVARLTGAQLIDRGHADRLSGTSIRSVLGMARQVVAEFHRTRIAR